ncbi:hypothetical protein [Bacillus mobilis]
MSAPIEVRIHPTSLGDVVSINGSWVNAADHEELAAVGTFAPTVGKAQAASLVP